MQNKTSSPVAWFTKMLRHQIRSLVCCLKMVILSKMKAQCIARNVSFLFQNKTLLSNKGLEKVNVLSCSTIYIRDNGRNACKFEDPIPIIFQNSHSLFSRNCFNKGLKSEKINLFSQVRNFSVSSVILQAEATTESNNELVLDFLPQKPTPASDTIEATTQFVGEPPFDVLGLASNWPSGWMQWFMEQVKCPSFSKSMII